MIYFWTMVCGVLSPEDVHCAVCVVTRAIMSHHPTLAAAVVVGGAAANCSIYCAPDYSVQEEDLSQPSHNTQQPDKSVSNI